MRTLAFIAVAAALACGLWAFVSYPHASPLLLIGGSLLFGLVIIPAVLILSATVTFFVLEGIDSVGVFFGWWKASDRGSRY